MTDTVTTTSQSTVASSVPVGVVAAEQESTQTVSYTDTGLLHVEEISPQLVTIHTSHSVATTIEAVQLVSVGAQGPAGPAGAAGGSDNITVAVTASGAISGHTVVVLDATGAPQYADNTVLTDVGKVLGITLNGAASGSTVSIRRVGEVTEPTWNWALNQPVYLGGGGSLTQTAPVTPAVFLQVVGFPVAPTVLFVAIREPILLA